MTRQYHILTFSALFAAAAGCRCGDPPCGVSSCPPACTSSPCKLTGNTRLPPDSCYDAVTGVPVPCPPPGAGMAIPGGYPAGPMPQPMAYPNELPPPGETIPPANIPNAQPVPAPGFGATTAPAAAQPVKMTPK